MTEKKDETKNSHFENLKILIIINQIMIRKNQGVNFYFNTTDRLDPK